MLSHLSGTLDKKTADKIVLDVNGMGYEISVSVSDYEKLSQPGSKVKLYIVESVSMYGGGVALYGFVSEESKELFMLLKDSVPGAGAKKALEYLDKISKSLSDFKRALIQRDAAILTGLFGFTKKTADKLISALKDKIGELEIGSREKWAVPTGGGSGKRMEAVRGLISLGFKEAQSREAVDKVMQSGENTESVEEIIKLAFSYI